jgi:RNA polymerase sigma-70 factor (ECF subfamily)
MRGSCSAFIDVDSCILGNNQTWRDFVEKYAGVVHAAVRKVIRAKVFRASEDDIQEVAQNVFMRLVKKDFNLLRRYDPARCSLATYLTIIARSTALDFLRYGFFNSIPLDDFDRDARVEAFEPDDSLELPEGVLTERQAVTLRLLFYKDYDVSMAAQALGVKAQTVRSIKHQALARLREHYGQARAS